jgi:UDP-glucose 4-epimerase
MDITGKKLLVIGGAGFIGSHVVDELLATDAKEIVIFDNFVRGTMENLEVALRDKRVKIFPHGGDILQTDILSKAMEGIDGVFHLAALWLLQCQEYPRAAFDVNIRGTFNVIEACIQHKVKRVVYSSSASVYGNALEVPMTENHPYNNQTFYGATKIAGEHMFKSLGHRYNMNWAGLRYMNVYGPRQDYRGAYIAVIMKILDNLDNGVAPVVYGDGSQQYDFVYVGDVARANMCAMKSDMSGECYNVGRGIGTSIRNLADLILKITGAKVGIEYKPEGQTFVTNRIGSTEKAEKEIHFKWSVDLEPGLKKLIEWRANHKKGLEHRRMAAGIAP